MRRAALLALVALAAVALAGCGGQAEKIPPGSPRTPVIQLLDAMRAGRPAQACALLPADEAISIRNTALASLVIPPGTHAERLAFIQRTARQAQGCVGGMRLLSRQLRDRLPTLRRAATTDRLTRPLHGLLWVIGDEQWFVQPRRGRWAILGENALSDASSA